MIPEDYIRIFDDCQHGADVYQRLSDFFETIDVDLWENELRVEQGDQIAGYLFAYYDSVRQLTDRAKYQKAIELFSLLENVFRNVLLHSLRPFVSNDQHDLRSVSYCYHTRRARSPETIELQIHLS